MSPSGPLLGPPALGLMIVAGSFTPNSGARLAVVPSRVSVYTAAVLALWAAGSGLEWAT